MITNEVPVTTLQAYFSLPRHIRNGMLIRMIVVSDLCTAVGCQELCLNVITPFTISVVFQFRDVP